MLINSKIPDICSIDQQIPQYFPDKSPTNSDSDIDKFAFNYILTSFKLYSDMPVTTTIETEAGKPSDSSLGKHTNLSRLSSHCQLIHCNYINTDKNTQIHIHKYKTLVTTQIPCKCSMCCASE